MPGCPGADRGHPGPGPGVQVGQCSAQHRRLAPSCSHREDGREGGEDAEKCEVRAQKVEGAPAVPVRAVDVRPGLRRLQFRVKLQRWRVSQETVLKVSHKAWVTVTGLGVEAAQRSRHGRV